MSDIYAYVTTYCNRAHRMSDGKPIEHECRIIPPRALKLEREGDFSGAIQVLQLERKPRYMMRGIKRVK